MSAQPFPGIAHVALTVQSLAVSRPWYQRLIGTEPVIDEPTGGGFHHTVFQIGSTLIGLHEHTATDDGAFSERHLGLDHLAFGCADRAELVAWGQRLDELGIEHSEIVDAPYGSGLSFRDPDGIALEFFAPPS
ncbi:VOC family protein [Lolliginicoccus suaedae]|uniref:VOC family protein n=1 Tax=Lolliginicoccus suaedae TaxID=2605429 RepID=UPI0011EDDD55|nr:VOC family protein [Lolliginicoccus suaedae]